MLTSVHRLNTGPVNGRTGYESINVFILINQENYANVCNEHMINKNMNWWSNRENS